MTTLEEDLLALRLRTIASLFAQLPAEAEYIAMQVNGDVIESAEYASETGDSVQPYPDGVTFRMLNAVFGHAHEGLRALAVPYDDLPKRVASSLLDSSVYADGYPVVLRRPEESYDRPLKFKPARENGDKSYTAVLQGGLSKTKEVWAPTVGAARKKVQATLPLHGRVVQIHRTPADAPRT